jgi:alpha-L-fucosidase
MRENEAYKHQTGEHFERYVEYMHNQVRELLTNYGKIDYLWFDGCGSEGHEFDRPRIVKAIGEMQPDILTFCDPEWSPGVRWIGNEDGFASLKNPLCVDKTDFSELSTEEQKLSSTMFLPAECDCKLRNTWFYDNNEDTVKSVDELFGMYEMSVGHGSNFLLNVSPDFRGLIPEADEKRFLELGDRIKHAYGKPLDYTKPVQNGDSYVISHKFSESSEWKMPSVKNLSNTLVISEDLAFGQNIVSFSVYAYLPNYKKRKIQVFEGKTVGHKIICRFSPIRATKYEVVINSSEAEHKIKDIKAFYVK